MTSSPVLGNGFYANKYNMVRRDSYNQFTPSEAINAEYTLADVYDDAAIIGSELEKIINNYGSDILKDLMPKVISVLELLESMTINKEKENDEVNELKMRINSLEMEKTTRNNEREKFEKELEEIDEKWKQETYRLIGMINKLKDENKRLNESLDQNRNIESKQNELLVIKQEELDYIRQIKDENIRLKESLRLKEREIEQKNSDNEGLISQIDRLNSTLLSLRRKQILAQNQIEKMVKSKAEIECNLTEKEHQLNLIKEKLKIKNLTEIIEKKDQKQEEAEREITLSQEKLSKDLTNLLIFDANDPNRPRFTLRELQKVLREKNELTIKLDQTQDELEQLKNQDNLNCGEVQGPINREPEEKLDPASKQPQSGIRRFLSKVISSFEDLRKLTKKHINSNLKAFENLESWAQESNNNAINDVSSKLSALVRQFSTDFGKDKASSFINVSNLFKTFKEHDAQLKDLQKNTASLLKREKQCLKDIQKCPSSKNIRDLEVKYQRTKVEREKSEIKVYELVQEIETTKSILFKKNLKSFTDALKKQNEAEKVLIEAMQGLLEQIPDVSGEEVDDINDITYKNKKYTEEICTEARKKLSSLSSSSLKPQNLVENQDGTIHVVTGQIEEEAVIEVKRGRNKTQTKSRILTRKISDVEYNNDKLYPSLNKISEEEPPKVPPPTYSDSENFYATYKSRSSSVLPSAPCIGFTDTNNSDLIQNNAFIRNILSPTRNI